jgi:DeoR/GlpR family transcriptional regulator of sugar metabolism
LAIIGSVNGYVSLANVAPYAMSKFAVRARHNIIGLSRIGTLVTDDGLSDSDAKMLADAGIRVIIAKSATETERP